jgi:hypothetical protein
MNDLTLNQIIPYADQLPADTVELETVFRDTVVSPIVGAVAATKNANLEIEVDKLSMDIFKFEQNANKVVQDITNFVDQAKVLLLVPSIGGFPVPESGVAVEELTKLFAEAEAFKVSLLAHNQVPLATAKSYLAQFISAINALISIVPSLGTYSIEGITVTEILSGLGAIVTVL